jgi:hypothetical protein
LPKNPGCGGGQANWTRGSFICLTHSLDTIKKKKEKKARTLYPPSASQPQVSVAGTPLAPLELGVVFRNGSPAQDSLLMELPVLDLWILPLTILKDSSRRQLEEGVDLCIQNPLVMGPLSNPRLSWMLWSSCLLGGDHSLVLQAGRGFGSPSRESR